MPDSLTPNGAPRSVWTLSEMRSRVRADLALTNANWLQNTDIDDWLNAAQWEAAVESKWLRISYVTGVTSGTAEYDLPFPASGRCIMIEAIEYDGNPLQQYKLVDFERYDARYRTLSGTPEAYTLRGNSTYRLLPTPNVTDSDIVTVVFAATPPRVSETSDKFYIPHGFDYALVDYACYRASLKDAHGEGARRVAEYKDKWERMWLPKLRAAAADIAERDVAVMGANGLRGLPIAYPHIPFYTSISE